MKIERKIRDARREAVTYSYAKADNIVATYVGFKQVKGQRTGDVAVVFAVKKKRRLSDISRDELIPVGVGLAIPTDVVQTGEISALSLTEKRRPCPPGYSIGHVSITAGTLGAWVRLLAGEDRYVLSNNHVLANSNDTQPHADIIQPGKADGGFSGTDLFARLHEYAVIRFGLDGTGGKDKKSSALARAWWSAWKAVPNAIAKLTRCPFRLGVINTTRTTVFQEGIINTTRHSARALDQPWPNLVDAALARPLAQSHAELEIPHIGEPAGIRDLELGDVVRKTGRTTEFQEGVVEGVDGDVRVSYGSGIASFTDQIIIGPGGFSDGGDSGSVIVDENNFIGALLFAGGDGITVGNRISNVVSVLGIRV